MSRGRSYAKEPCFNPQCINGGSEVDMSGNPDCWIETSKSVKGFCSSECRAHYQDNLDEIMEAERYQNAIKKDDERYAKKYHEEMVKGIYLCCDKQLDEQTISKVIRLLKLKSEPIERRLSRIKI